MSLSVCNYKEMATDRDHKSFARVSGSLYNCPCEMQVMCKVSIRGVVKGYLVLSRQSISSEWRLVQSIPFSSVWTISNLENSVRS